MRQALLLPSILWTVSAIQNDLILALAFFTPVDPGIAIIVVAIIGLFGSILTQMIIIWQNGRIHQLVNSNFSEQKAIILALQNEIVTLKAAAVRREPRFLS